MNKTRLRKYAHLIAKVGANVQKGQEVLIRSTVETPEFALMVSEECYKLGAKEVTVEWRYSPLSKLHYKKRSLKTHLIPFGMRFFMQKNSLFFFFHNSYDNKYIFLE